jgi:hypothetical protein
MDVDDSEIPQTRHPLLGELTVSFVEGLGALQPSDRGLANSAHHGLAGQVAEGVTVGQAKVIL